MKKKILVLVLIVLAVMGYYGIRVVNASYVKVSPGQRAVKTEWGVIQDTTYRPGLVWFVPYTKEMGNEVFVVDVKPQRYEYNISGRTKDMQRVTWNCAVLCEMNEDKIHVMYDKYINYAEYEQKVIRDLVQTTMLSLSSMADFWSIAGNERNMITSAVEYIVNDQLISENLVSVSSLRILNYSASAEFEALIEQTMQARQGITLEEYKAEMAKAATERVKQEAIQTYERMAAEVKARGLEFQITAEAVNNNPFIAQYELAKALQKWNGNISLPQTLTMMEGASDGASIFPFIGINGGNGQNGGATVAPIIGVGGNNQ